MGPYRLRQRAAARKSRFSADLNAAGVSHGDRQAGADVADRRGFDWRLFSIMYAVVVAVFVVRAVYGANNGAPLLADTDDAMRLVAVRDFLAGQSWYDNVQHRLNTPFGAELHWSRLADLPLAGLIVLLRPVLGAGADMVAAYILPLLLLFALLYLSGRVTLKLAGGEGLLAAFALPAFSLSVLGEFAPGRIDHHSLQILLLLAIVWCALEALTRPRFAIGAGLAAATAIAVGVEGLPAVGAAIIAFGLMWVGMPQRADALRWFGLSFAVGTLVHLGLALPPERWLTPACDAISFTYAIAAIGTGAAFGILSLLPLAAQPAWLRLVVGAAVGGVLALALALAFPACLDGPYSMLDPWLLANWIDRITEAQPLWIRFLDDPVYPVAVVVPPLVALAVALWRVSRNPGDGRGEWLVYLCFLVLAIAAMLVQIRASRMATVVAVPAGAALIAVARQWYLERKSPASIAGLVGSWLISAGLAVALAASAVANLFPGYAESLNDPGRGSKHACLAPAAFADLAAMPPERVMTPIDLGAHLLAFTPHHVVAAPYHRNDDGVRDALQFFNSPIDAARAILERREVTLVVTCRHMPEMRGLADAPPDSFVKLYATDALPGWLVDHSLPDTPLQVFSVTPR